MRWRLVTGGVHGGEYPGIEAAIRLARVLDPHELRGAVVLVHPVKLPAFHARQQYLVPQDGKNLNRQFPGRALGTAGPVHHLLGCGGRRGRLSVKGHG